MMPSPIREFHRRPIPFPGAPAGLLETGCSFCGCSAGDSASASVVLAESAVLDALVVAAAPDSATESSRGAVGARSAEIGLERCDHLFHCGNRTLEAAREVVAQRLGMRVILGNLVG